MVTLFKSSSDFGSLSLKDLVEARDLFHYQLINKKNVIATALGLYLIRKSDPWPSRHDQIRSNRQKKRERRTLFNSEIRPYSWPCIYVFVSDWEYEVTLAGDDPSDVVPRSLYLSDGRAVPVCVIEPPDVTVSTSRRTLCGCSIANRAAMTPPMDWATRSTGPSIFAVTMLTRSSMPLIAGSCGWFPSPGQPKYVLDHSAGSRAPAGFQKSGEAPAPGKNRTLVMWRVSP